jgi:hypothetical protein
MMRVRGVHVLGGTRQWKKRRSSAGLPKPGGFEEGKILRQAVLGVVEMRWAINAGAGISEDWLG